MNKKYAGTTAQEVRAARKKAGLVQAAAAEIVFTTLRNWQQWEYQEATMHPGLWELFQIKTKLKTVD